MKGINQGTLVTLDDALRAIDNLRMTLRSLPIFIGEGAPEGVQSGSTGSLYLRMDGGTSTTLYIKESSATDLTGWIAK